MGEIARTQFEKKIEIALNRSASVGTTGPEVYAGEPTIHSAQNARHDGSASQVGTDCVFAGEFGSSWAISRDRAG
jgi:hypothetical protein